MAEVIPFRDPSLPAEGTARLHARRAYRESCKVLAADAIASAFRKSGKMLGGDVLGINDAAIVFVAAMRRELRKTGMF